MEEFAELNPQQPRSGLRGNDSSQPSAISFSHQGLNAFSAES